MRGAIVIFDDDDDDDDDTSVADYCIVQSSHWPTTCQRQNRTDMSSTKRFVGPTTVKAVVTTTIRLRFDGHSTAYRSSLRSQ